jgi:hypothetical protein
MKRTPWNAVAVLCLVAAVVAGCATGRPQTLGHEISDKFGKCEFTYRLEPGTTKIAKGSVTLSEEAKKNKCETKDLEAGYFGGDPAKGKKVSDILGTDVRIETMEENVRLETPRGWCCRWYPSPSGGWTYICYPC